MFQGAGGGNSDISTAGYGESSAGAPGSQDFRAQGPVEGVEADEGEARMRARGTVIGTATVWAWLPVQLASGGSIWGWWVEMVLRLEDGRLRVSWHRPGEGVWV